MKYFCLFALFLALVSCSSAASWGKHTGEPGCQTEEEVAVGNYRHWTNKNVYWQCTALGAPATLAQCPVAHGYLDDAKQCVHYSEWYWTPTVLPPTQPLAAAA